MLEPSPAHPAGAPAPPMPAPARPAAASRERLAWVLVALITIAAGALRLYRIDRVALDPFYDAAVRSMSLSAHNFFFGAMEPGGSVAIDKPPVDLWLQVASVKLVGFGATGLMLPEALIGTASVPLLFAAVRRIWSTPAGLAAALVLAFLPIEVITARSDTMDAVMMALLVLALLWIARAAQQDSNLWLGLAAAALGLAFDVKLTESLLALPGLVVFAFFALPGSPRRRLLRLTGAGAVYVVVALAWLLATLAFPAAQRPFAYGSDNGSAWDAALVYNGLDRLESKAAPGQNAEPYAAQGAPPSRYAALTQSERESLPLRAPSAGRLLDRVGPLSGVRLGFVLLAALLLALPALAFELWGRLRAPPREPEAPPEAADTARRRRIALAGLAGLVVWLLTGTVLFSQMVHLHPRYTEGFTPAVAACVGIGLAWATARAGVVRLAVLALALGVLAVYAEQLLFGAPLEWWVMLAGTLGALGLASGALLAARTRPPLQGQAWLRTGAFACALVGLLAIPLSGSVRAVEHNASDTNRLGVLRAGELDPLGSYLRSHQGSAYYEVAYDAASKMGALVVHDARPVLVLDTVNSQVVTPLARLRTLIAAGKVRFAVLNELCGPHTSRENADCSASARWIAAHGRNISSAAGLGRHGILWLLPGATA